MLLHATICHGQQSKADLRFGKGLERLVSSER